jgi:hypothetical protein
VLECLRPEYKPDSLNLAVEATSVGKLRLIEEAMRRRGVLIERKRALGGQKECSEQLGERSGPGNPPKTAVKRYVHRCYVCDKWYVGKWQEHQRRHVGQVTSMLWAAIAQLEEQQLQHVLAAKAAADPESLSSSSDEDETEPVAAGARAAAEPPQRKRMRGAATADRGAGSGGAGAVASGAGSERRRLTSTARLAAPIADGGVGGAAGGGELAAAAATRPSLSFDHEHVGKKLIYDLGSLDDSGANAVPATVVGYYASTPETWLIRHETWLISQPFYKDVESDELMDGIHRFSRGVDSVIYTYAVNAAAAAAARSPLSFNNEFVGKKLLTYPAKRDAYHGFVRAVPAEVDASCYVVPATVVGYYAASSIPGVGRYDLARSTPETWLIEYDRSYDGEADPHQSYYEETDLGELMESVRKFETMGVHGARA